MLYVIAAPSGAGKTTIVREILKSNPEIVFSVSATTREKRSGEADGKDYFYFTKDEFKKKIANDELVEYEILFNGDYYGTLKTYVEKNLKEGKDMIFDVDVNGALSIKKLYGLNARLIFIMPPEKETLIKRLKNRATESKEQIEERIKRVDLEIGKANDFDYIVVNDKLDKAVNEVQKIISQSNTKKDF
ncbi:MAG: Guanylate kinase [Ignavibacteria bacterium]|nr:Guanylate kinase [Ignavibacteria bacterium]